MSKRRFDLRDLDRTRIAGAAGIGVVSASLAGSNFGTPGLMGLGLIACGAIGLVASGALITEEVRKARARRVARELADYEATEKLRLAARSERNSAGVRRDIADRRDR